MKATRQDDLRALGLFALSRAWIALVATSSVALVTAGPHWPIRESVLESLLAPRWDELHYLAIAANDYEPDTHHVAFFPAFPLLFGTLARLFGLPLVTAARIVANGAGALAFVLFARLCRRDASPSVTFRAVALLAFFPTSFYFSIAYTESLFFLCVVGALLASRSRRWLLAALCGYFASFCRANGFVLLVPIVVEYVLAQRAERRPILGLPLFAFVLVPAGLFAFMLHLLARTGDLLAYAHMGRSQWNRGLSWVWVTVERSIVDHRDEPSTLAMLLAYPLASLAGVLLATRQRVRFAQVAYASAMLFLILSIGHLDSVGRYVIVLAPMYVGFARAARVTNTGYALLLAAFIAGLTVSTTMHFRGYFII